MILLNKGQIIYLYLNDKLTLAQITSIDESTELVTCQIINYSLENTSEPKEFTIHKDYLIRLNDSFISEKSIIDGKENVELYYSPYKNILLKTVVFHVRRLLNVSISQDDYTHVVGKVLHLDGDKDYLKTCFEHYKNSNIEILCKYVKEVEQPYVVYDLLNKFKPDILILTGHDGIIPSNKDLKSIESYRNSKYFIDAVKKARTYEKDKEKLFIFAGGCQSYYEGLLRAGANWASSPKRILVHALDPVLIGVKVALTSVNEIIPPDELANLTISGPRGIGGIRSHGKCRSKINNKRTQKQTAN